MSPIEERRKRTLTDDDAQAIADAFNYKLMKEQILNEIYQDIGKGVFGIIWKMFVTALIGIAAYGATKGFHFKD